MACPLRWDELKGLKAAAPYNVKTLPARLKALKRDPWEGFFSTRQSITAKAQEGARPRLGLLRLPCLAGDKAGEDGARGGAGAPVMTRWTPDPTFYPSPRLAAKAPAETLAYVAAFAPNRDVPDAIAVVDVDPASPTYSKIVGGVDMPQAGDELHHYGWNACSSCLCPNAPHPHMERRYLVVPGLRSSRIYIIDTKPDPNKPDHRAGDRAGGVARGDRLLAARTPSIAGLTASMSRRSATPRATRPGGVFLMDPETFDVLGRWEVERGPQQLAYDAWWHLGYDTMVTSEWGTPNTFENGLMPEILLGAQYGRRLHFWDLQKRKHLQEIDFGPDYQLVFELRPAHDPTKAYGFVNCVISLKDLSSSIWTWYRDGDKWAVKKVIEIPAEPADPDLLPPVLKGFKAVPPLVTDIDLSMDDRFLYVACWGTGDLRQYDVSDPFNPKLTGKVGSAASSRARRIRGRTAR